MMKKSCSRETAIGDCKVMFFDIWSVLSLYENELKRDPYGLWGMIRHEYGDEFDKEFPPKEKLKLLGQIFE
jgi:hypothetical protein